MCVRLCEKKNYLKKRVLFLAVVVLVSASRVVAQDGTAGLQQADSMVRGYFATATNLMYAVGAIVGIVGAIRVYQKWSAGHPDTGSTAAAWFGSCVFLVVVATVIKSFFGIA